jgi:hypothetical protein
VEQSYDAGLLFELLAKNSPMFSYINQELTGANRRGSNSG